MRVATRLRSDMVEVISLTPVVPLSLILLIPTKGQGKYGNIFLLTSKSRSLASLLGIPLELVCIGSKYPRTSGTVPDLLILSLVPRGTYCLSPKWAIHHKNFVVALKVNSGVENVHCCSVMY